MALNINDTSNFNLDICRKWNTWAVIRRCHWTVLRTIYIVGTYESRRLNSPAIQLFLYYFFRLTTKKRLKFRIAASYKGPVMWEALQWRHNGRDNVSNHWSAIVYSTVYSGADQRKHQSSASLAFVRGIHRGPVNSPHKWQVMRENFPFDDVIMAFPSLDVIKPCVVIYHNIPDMTYSQKIN